MIEFRNVRDIFAAWLKDNAPRIRGRFEIDRTGDWGDVREYGIGLVLLNDQVVGQVSAWPQHSEVDWPFADALVLNADTSEVVFAEDFSEFGPALLDRWLAALESKSISETQNTQAITDR